MARIEEEVNMVFQDDRHRFITNLVFTASWFKMLVTEYLKPYGLSLQQHNILRILRGAGDWLAMSDVKSRMIDKSPNATRLADKLLDKRLIERKRSDTDRRIVYVRISKAGLKLLTQTDEMDHDQIPVILERVDPKQAVEFSKLLDQMRG